MERRSSPPIYIACGRGVKIGLLNPPLPPTNLTPLAPGTYLSEARSGNRRSASLLDGRKKIHRNRNTHLTGVSNRSSPWSFTASRSWRHA